MNLIMANQNDIIAAVNNSINFNRIARLGVEDIRLAVHQITALYDEVDSVVEPDGSVDIWGKAHDWFRLTLTQQ